MKTNKELFVASKLTLAVQGALVAMLAMPIVAYAEDSDVATLTQPTNSVNIGATDVSGTGDFGKFGEYNGMNKKQGYLNGDFSVRGGDAYEAFTGGDGTKRWDFNGTDIGTTSRNIGASASDQGTWNIGVGFDQLRHQITDTFQTPLVGSMGGNNFTLPSNFGYINTSNANNTVANGGIASGIGSTGTQMLAPSQLADFNTQDVYSERQNATLTAGYNFDKQWNVKFDFNQLVQSGAKLISAGTDGTVNTAVNGGLGPYGSNFKGESPIMLMNPTDYKTDTFNFALNWAGDNAYGTASFYSSVFTDNNNSVSFPNPFVGDNTKAPTTGTLSNTNPNSQVLSGIPYPTDYLSTAPSNTFTQVNLNGGYTFSPATKLVGGVSTGNNTQNDSYMPGAVMQANGLPQASLNGKVVTTHADLKLTNQTTNDLSLSAGVKYNKRDNQTASSVYSWYDIGGNGTGQAESAVNTPQSNKKTQWELAGDYRINQNNRVHFGLERETINRWCDNAAANLGEQAMINGTIVQNGGLPPTYFSGANTCVQVPDSGENKAVLNYKLRASENVNVNLGYSYANRSADNLGTYYSPIQAKTEGYNAAGYVAFFDASRIEQTYKAGVNWQANDKLSLSVNGRATRDTYPNSTYGVSDGNTVGGNVDATYSYSESNMLSAYLSWQDRQQNLTNEVTPTTVATGYNTGIATNGNAWTNNQDDNSTTIGLSGKQKGLFGGKYSFSEDLAYSIDKSNYTTSTYTNGSNAATCGLVTSLTCGSTPDITSEMLRIKLGGSYQVDKASKVNVGYMFQKLTSTDYYYNALQYGYTPTSVMPSNQQAPSYSVNVVSASYVYSF